MSGLMESEALVGHFRNATENRYCPGSTFEREILPEQTKEAVYDYMREGRLIEKRAEHFTDIYTGKDMGTDVYYALIPLEELKTGFGWIWTLADLYHFVEYDAKLDPEFIQFALDHPWEHEKPTTAFKSVDLYGHYRNASSNNYYFQNEIEFEKLPLEEKSRILKFMNSHVSATDPDYFICVMLEYVDDVYTGSQIGAPRYYGSIPFKELETGFAWVWSTLDIYYFDKYDAKLDPEFIEFVLNHEQEL